jgi:hypothetical protein
VDRRLACAASLVRAAPRMNARPRAPTYEPQAGARRAQRTNPRRGFAGCGTFAPHDEHTRDQERPEGGRCGRRL